MYYIHIYQVYVELGSSLGPITLNVLSMGGKSRSFDIRVTQIHCASQYKGKTKCDLNQKLLYLFKNMILFKNVNVKHRKTVCNIKLVYKAHLNLSTLKMFMFLQQVT